MALKGLKVLEFAGLAPSPFTGLIFSDFGADVVVVDRVGGGGAPPAMQRGKRSISLDLKNPLSKQVIYKMITQFDILVEPFRPGVMERLGLGPEELLKLNPKLIYARLTGFGQKGTYAPMAGHDINYLAVSGVLSALGTKSLPSPPSNLLADFAGGGAMCALGILIALYERERSGKGQVIDAAMQDGVLYLASQMWKLKPLLPAPENSQGRNYFNAGAPFYRCYECKDGGFMSVGAIEPQFYSLFLKLMGLEKEIDKNVQNDSDSWEGTVQIIERQFKTKTRDEWQAVFDGKDACVVPVLELEEVHNHAHNKTRNVLVPSATKTDNVFLDFDPAPAPLLSRTPGSLQARPVPKVGEHSVGVLKENGFTEKEIEALMSGRVVIQKKAAL
uniref:Alpha-methylacyl-CoA racemase n=1 Tax=Arcella intermedia TaxID=1963864 RepID=A0A6B2L6T9_9EUKA